MPDQKHARFHFQQILQIVLLKRCINLFPYQQCKRMPVSPHPCQTSLIFDNLSDDGISKYLVYIFLIVNKVEHFSNHLNVLCISFYVNSLWPLLIFLLDSKSSHCSDSFHVIRKIALSYTC